MKPIQHPLSTFALAVLALTAMQTAGAQETAAPAPDEAASAVPNGKLETVVVTAERRAANIQKTSISMQAVTGNEITQQGLSSGTEILKNVANVEVQGAARGNMIAIRGIGSDLPPGMGESAVSTNFDGVYNFRAEMNTLGLFDLDRVEVLRGPQGTLYGRNAAAGAVNYITRDPVIGQSGGNASLELGNNNLMRGEAGFSMPVNDTVALRASVASISRDGFLSDGYNDAKASGARLKMLVKPSESLRLLVGAERIHLGGKGPGFIEQSNWNNADTRLQAPVNSASPGLEKVGYQDFTADKLWAQLDANVGIGTLTVLPAYQDAHGVVYRRYDASKQSPEQYNADPAVSRQKSLEVRLSADKASTVQWVVGAYGYDMLNAQTCLLDATTCASSNNTRDTTKSNALFGQATVPLAPSLRMLLGARHTRDRKTAIDGSEGSWKSTDGKFGLEYDLGAQAMSYLTWASAYRPGGFNTLPGNTGTFEEEKLRSIELGVKSRWLDNTLQFNGAVFQYNYKNYQAVDFAVVGGTLYAAFLNVPNQTVRGVEAETQYVLPIGSRLRASMTYLDAKLGNLETTDSSGAKVSQAGNPLPHAPKLALKTGYEHPLTVAGGQLTLRGDVRWTDKQYVSITENDYTLQPAYTQVDLSALYRPDDSRWAVNLYVKNATDYVTKSANFAGYTMVGAPRTYGVVLSTKF